jgi:long-chain acyl-CoA synthetase
MAMTETANDLAALALPQQLMQWAGTRPDAVALRQKELGIWQPVTWAAYAQTARHFGLGLLQLGLKPGEVG